MGDITKLPKWAQQRIAVLERNLAHANEKLSAGPANSTVIADPYSDAPRPLGTGTQVQFNVPGARYDYFSVRLEDDGTLYVLGSNSYAVRPHTSNAVSFELRRR